MKVPLGWLAEWIPLPDLDTLQERLTVGGLEIEEVIHSGPDLSGIRVGEVQARETHPDADRLSVCTVDLGEEEPLEIVCGAPNVAAGQKVAVATHGVVLPGGLKIKRSKIRGVRSHGMICSAQELGLGEDPEGILVLDPGAQVGEPLSSAMPAGETILDFEITPNRGDWVSMLGMAREVRAHFGGSLTLPPCEVSEGGGDASDDIEIAIEDREGCYRYVGCVIHGVTVGPSPEWLQRRLEDAGFRSVNNVVDVTNLVLLEFGQPLHAFDLERLRGGKIIVRSAREGEKLLTLDGEDRELRTEDLVIADAEGAVAVAGVMGGGDSEVRDTTTSLLLESAHFHPGRVRRTAKRLGLRSDASYRFERGVDPDGQSRAADRAARLICELAGGELARGAVEVLGENAPHTEELALAPERVNRLLGTKLTADEIVALLARVDIEAQAGPEGVLRCRPPRYRSDVHIEADLIEEVARIHGYDQIEASLPTGRLEGIQLSARRATTEAVRSSLAGAGLSEIMTFPGCPPEDDDRLGLAEDDPRRTHVPLLNPIQAGDAVLRSHLLPSVLRAVRGNRARQAERVRVFEIGRVFVGGPDRPEAWHEREPLQAAVALCEAGAEDLWRDPEVPVFFRAKGIAERLLADLGRRAEFRARADEPFLHPGACGEFRCQGRPVATLGELHPTVAAAFEIDAPTAVLMIDMEALDGLRDEPMRYRELSRHPRMRRDLALLVDRDTPSGEVLQVVQKKAGAALLSAQFFDRYEGKGVPEGKVSLAIRLLFQRVDRTLTDAEVAEATERVVQVLAERFGAELR
ncbi:MAG: phenylalanine--tRNA ligase subunit beta [Deltaproteobacteria bacterium]|nr:phenylalanine--tRNA ligase subunit beta [Deltaproteobacteria bacterium]